MGWEMPWYAMKDRFEVDSASTSGTARTRSSVTVTTCSAPTSSNSRGDEALGSTWSYLDLGRQEEWEDSPKGYPQGGPYVWWGVARRGSAAGVDRPGLIQLRIKGESADPVPP